MMILLHRGTFDLPWESRQALLDQFGHLESPCSLRQAFEAVGTLHPATLTREQKGQLVEVIEFWATQVGFASLPEGIYELRNALRDDLHDR